MGEGRGGGEERQEQAEGEGVFHRGGGESIVKLPGACKILRGQTGWNIRGGRALPSGMQSVRGEDPGQASTLARATRNRANLWPVGR